MPKKIAALLFVCSCFLPLQVSGGDDLAKLGKARVDAAEKAYKGWYKAMFPKQGLLGTQSPEMFYHLSTRWLAAQLDMTAKKEERIAACDAHLQRMKELERRFKVITGSEGALFDVIQSYLREAEFWLAKERSPKK